MKHIFVQVGSQNAIVINTNKFENNSMNSLWPFYVAVTEPVVIATSSFLSTVSRNTAAVFFVPQERHKCLISGLINIFKFWLKYFYCTIILLLFLLQVYNISVSFYLFFTFRLHHTACRILVLCSGIKSMPSAVKVQSSNYRTAREFPLITFLINMNL